jgi:hypothetical protein
MALLPFQQYWPLAAVGVWWGLCLYQVYRDRYRTWTEVFFLTGCFFVGAYALSDVFFFTAGSPQSAATAARMSFTVLTLAVYFIFLFALVFYTRMRTAYALTLLPAVGLIALVWTGLIPSLTAIVPYNGPPAPPAAPWLGNWDKTIFLIWVLGGMGYGVLAAFFLLWTYREVSDHTTKLRRRMLGLLLTTIVALFLGGTNVLRSVASVQILPLFSTGLVLPGIVSVITLSPSETERFSVAVRRWKASRYDIKAAFMIFTDGTLIGAKVRSGEKVIDQDLFGATLDVIQNFMKTSFPTLGGSLRTIKLGDNSLVVERGRFAYLTLVLHGEENDQLRRHIRDLLLQYEHDNQPILEDWRGMPSEAIGTDALLGSLFEDT